MTLAWILAACLAGAALSFTAVPSESARDEAFAAGGVDIHYLERWLQERNAA